MSTLLDCPDRIHLDRWNWASWFRIGLQPWPHQSPCAHSAPRGLAGRLVPPAAPLRGGERDADWHWYSRSGRCAQTRQAWGSLFNGVHRNLTGSGAESAAPPSRVFGGGKGGRRACGARVAILRFCIDEQLCRRGRGERVWGGEGRGRKLCTLRLEKNRYWYTNEMDGQLACQFLSARVGSNILQERTSAYMRRRRTQTPQNMCEPKANR